MSEPLEATRRFYAEELRFTARLRSPAVVAAFASVRESVSPDRGHGAF